MCTTGFFLTHCLLQKQNHTMVNWARCCKHLGSAVSNHTPGLLGLLLQRRWCNKKYHCLAPCRCSMDLHHPLCHCAMQSLAALHQNHKHCLHNQNGSSQSYQCKWKAIQTDKYYYLLQILLTYKCLVEKRY